MQADRAENFETNVRKLTCSNLDRDSGPGLAALSFDVTYYPILIALLYRQVSVLINIVGDVYNTVLTIFG
jgi:hypothetical protein